MPKVETSSDARDATSVADLLRAVPARTLGELVKRFAADSGKQQLTPASSSQGHEKSIRAYLLALERDDAREAAALVEYPASVREREALLRTELVRLEGNPMLALARIKGTRHRPVPEFEAQGTDAEDTDGEGTS